VCGMEQESTAWRCTLTTAAIAKAAILKFGGVQDEPCSLAASRGEFGKPGQPNFAVETKKAAEAWLSTLQTELDKRNRNAYLE
jgi:hypothetical protein